MRTQAIRAGVKDHVDVKMARDPRKHKAPGNVNESSSKLIDYDDIVDLNIKTNKFHPAGRKDHVA